MYIQYTANKLNYKGMTKKIPFSRYNNYKEKIITIRTNIQMWAVR